MILPSYICTKCGKHNDAIEMNLRTRQQGKVSTGEVVFVRLRSISRECMTCGKQKIVTGLTD